MTMKMLQHKKVLSSLRVTIAMMVGLVLGMVASESSYAQSVGTGSVNVTLEAPGQVRVGEVITLRLRLDGDIAVGGFEAQLLYARTAAEFAGFSPASPSGDLSIGQLVVPEMAMGSAVGYYTCGTTPCMNRREAQVQAATEPGALGEVEVLALAAGTLEVRLGHISVVDSTGQAIAVTLAQPSVVIQVGEGAEAHNAPTVEWAWASTRASAASVTAADITQDGAVTHGDVMEAALAWQSVREAGDPCSGREASADINGDGCVDITDVQTAAAYATAQNTPVAEAPSQFPQALYLPQIDGEGGESGVTSDEEIALAQATATMTLTVNSTLDESDADLNDGVCQSASAVCTLRAAIQQANTNAGSNLIVFAIPGSGVHTIQLENRLPALSDSTGGTTIDGYSQAEAAPNTDVLVSNAQIRIEIRGEGFGGFDGLPITSAENVVKGLSFFDLKRSLWIYGAGAYENVIVGNFIGTNAAGTFAAATVSEEQAHGIHVEQGALGNRIGGQPPAERNVISGNARHGVGFWHVGTDENLVINNLVGLSPDGLHRIPNRQQGVDINYAASFNIVGGLAEGERNVISGNGVNGAEISHGETTTENVFRGNFIGTNVSGESAPAYASNGGVGISLHDRIMNNLVTENVIGNNRSGGILINSLGNCCTTDNRIEKNWIGVTPGGKNIGNGVFGIHLLAPRSQIGPGNVIAYNAVGVRVEGEENDGNTITENSIYGNIGPGIDLAPLGQINQNDEGDGDSGPNEQLNFPILQSVSLSEVSGWACGSCRVEIFIADEASPQYGEGKTFIGAGTAGDNGAFTVEIANVAFGQYLTATATDVNGNTSEFSRNVLLANPSNDPPVAVNDAATTMEGKSVTVDVLINDDDPEGNALTVVAVGAPANGDATTNGATVVYTPVVDFTGTDSFTYTVSDGNGGTSIASVAVTVEEDTTGTGSPGITINPTQLDLTDGGSPVTYTIVLESEPTAAVTVTITADAPIVVNPQQLLFTRQNWDAPQVVTVSVGDSEVNVAQTSEVFHSVQSADSDYDGMDGPILTVTYAAAGTPGAFLPSISR